MWNVTADLLPALPAEQLALTRHVSAPFKAVSIGTVTFLLKDCSSDAERGVRSKLAGQECEMVRVKGDVTIQIADDFPMQASHSFISSVESPHLCGKTAIAPLRHLDEFHPSVLRKVASYDLGRVVRGPIVHDHPFHR